MRAARFATFGGPDVLQIEEIDRPSPADGDVLVRVKAAALQPYDRRVRAGELPLPPGVALPLTTGNEFSGVIEAVGPGVSGFAPGDAVAGRRSFGAAAEFLTVPATDIALKPDALSFAEAATIGGTAQTADIALETLRVGPGDVLLIHGAAGGVGSFATQLALWRGATVIGTGSPANQDYLRELGATPLVYGDGLSDRIAAAAPDGLTAILDCAGGEALDLSLTLGVPHTRIVSLGDRRAHALGLPAAQGVRDGQRLAKLLALAAEGHLQALVRRTYPLDRIVDAHQDLDTGHGRGKIVVLID